jgi:hypothetical protein
MELLSQTPLGEQVELWVFPEFLERLAKAAITGE